MRQGAVKGVHTASNGVPIRTLTTPALFSVPRAGTNLVREVRIYDAAGQLVARYHARGNGTFFTCNAVGQKAKITDARLVSTTNALANVTTMGYDASGNETTEGMRVTSSSTLRVAREAMRKAV